MEVVEFLYHNDNPREMLIFIPARNAITGVRGELIGLSIEENIHNEIQWPHRKIVQFFI